MRMILILITRYGIRVAEARQADYESVLAERGLRPTRQRVAVLGALASRDDATAQQIHALLADDGVRVGLATVYRTLKSLSESGVVDTLSHHRGETCYRLCGEGHHHHLVCSGCHRVVELGRLRARPVARRPRHPARLRARSTHGRGDGPLP